MCTSAQVKVAGQQLLLTRADFMSKILQMVSLVYHWVWRLPGQCTYPSNYLQTALWKELLLHQSLQNLIPEIVAWPYCRSIPHIVFKISKWALFSTGWRYQWPETWLHPKPEPKHEAVGNVTHEAEPSTHPWPNYHNIICILSDTSLSATSW